MVEALAKEGIKLAIDHSFQEVMLETDSSRLHYILTKDSKDINWRARPIVLDLLNNLQLILEKKVVLVRQNANKAADRIAKQSCKGMCVTGFIGQFSSSLIGIFDKDGYYNYGRIQKSCLQTIQPITSYHDHMILGNPLIIDNKIDG
ncbi:hypothetical protein REPUB_Repub18cG0041700 [Reevesia pubescens]